VSPVAAVVFDLDGVLVDSEQMWDESRRSVVAEAGGRWRDSATRDMMGMSAPEWSAYLRDGLGVPLEASEINDRVVAAVMEHYGTSLPLLPGAVDVVRRLAERWPLGLASSANRPVIDFVLQMSGLGDCFGATVSSEEVARGKPAPDVYLAAASALGVDAAACVGVEDSSNGMRAVAAAGMAVVAVPNPHFPPDDDAVALASLVVQSLGELTVEAVSALRR
jgi:HAD superfamily hydrolase (TIGR01509 family)